MAQEEKELLLKDLCARLPYNVIINCTEEDDEKTNFNCFLAPDMIKDIKLGTAFWVVKPYLRPMYSMTEEEVKEYKAFHCVVYEHTHFYPQFCTVANELNMFDWLNAHHFDYRGLIKKDLAIEAPEEIYNN